MHKMLRYILIPLLFTPAFAFAASSQLAATSKSVVNLTYNTVTLQADVTPSTDVADNVYHFEWGVVGNYSDDTFITPDQQISGWSHSVKYDLNGLAPSTQYYFRIVAENQNDRVTGQTIYFTTKAYNTNPEAIVIATTRNATAVRDTGAVVHAYVAPHTGYATYWFEWGYDNSVSEVTNDRSVGFGGGEVYETLSNLTPGTTYYYRIAAQNDRGIVRGEIMSFKTTGVKPVVEDPTNQTLPTPNSKKGSGTHNGNDFFGSFINTSGSQKAQPESTQNTQQQSNANLAGSVGSAVQDVTVSVKPNGNSGAHQTIEYRVSYEYDRNEPAKKASLELYVPATLVYTGDTTANELRVKNADNGARVFILPIGKLNAGDNRSFSFLAMTTGDAKGIPEIQAKLVFTTAGNQQLFAGATSASGSGWSLFGSSNSSKGNGDNTASTGGVFPSALIWWLVLLNVLAAGVIGIIKLKDHLAQMRANIAAEQQKANDVAAQIRAQVAQPTLAPAMVTANTVIPGEERPVIAQFEQELEGARGQGLDQFGLPGAYAV